VCGRIGLQSGCQLMEGVIRKQARSTRSRNERKMILEAKRDAKLYDTKSSQIPLRMLSNTGMRNCGTNSEKCKHQRHCGVSRHKGPPCASNCQKVKTNITLSICEGITSLLGSTLKIPTAPGIPEYMNMVP
jgi:hypothetical protein